ncbi:putative lysine-specific demethylase JMJ16 [Gastrolobium bilobum]|uniref:putative lysine-specific demethylase JMJ16 n=1 Tax=Gastrolobium bilobum TaxID=150636 RepID=UPI002AB2878A|nr:putative lysine-specific demethylase JMJ16 [Gastrolobium bilobum]XP_061343444.1 putative lysine-specific demethylase JMJ16 [Gastrolobium bilobum]
MEADYGSNCAKIEKMGNLSVPPGFASLTSFNLKRVGKVKKTDKSTTASEHEPVHVEIKPEMNGITAYNQILMHRPWIILDQSNQKPEESHTEHLPMDIPSNACRPKGTIRGCPNCSNCLKVTARWNPEDARREVLEEAPIFHPTEEEFKDTLKYIASIRSRAEPYGICRIVPPTCWKPPCLLEEKNIWENSEFVAQVQRIDGHQIQHAKEIMASSCENTKTKRRRGTKVALDSQLGNRSTCTTNNQNIEDYESEPGPKFSLKTFKKHADEFKIQYFNYKEKNKIMDSDINLAIHQQQWEPSVENIEGEYGRIVQNPTEEIEVLCGNTLEAGVFISGFPTVSGPLETCPYPEYLKSGWNLNNILSLLGSLLSFESSEASRNFAPRIHVGMCFSPLNWKVEEHHLYSLSYMHLGGPKVWYSVPGRFAVNFETIQKKYLPDLCARQPDMHDNLVMQLSCSILKAEGIPVYRCVQYPREFVLVFPGAYNSGFDCGFNCIEAVSFTPLEWLLHGQNVVELYCEQRRKTIISYDKLLLGAAREAVRAQWETDLCMKSTPDKLTCKDAYQRNGILAKVLESRVKSESLKREFLCISLISGRMDENFDATCKRECSICLRDLHLSAICCSCSEDKFACLNHAKQLCFCPWSNKTLLYRYEISELNVLCQAVDGKLSAVYKWAKEDLGLTVHSLASKRSNQTPENVGGSTHPSKDLKMKEPMPHTGSDACSEWKQLKSQAISNASKRKQNEVASQVKGTSSSSYGFHSKMKTTLLQSTIPDEIKAKEKMPPKSISGGKNAAGIKNDMKALAGKRTISKKVEGDPKVSKVSSVTNSNYLSFLQENTLFEISSDSSSTSTSSESDDDT